MKKLRSSILVWIIILSSIEIAQGEDWPMRGHDAAHTGMTGETLEAPLELLWKYQTDGHIGSTAPAIVDGTVYIGSDDGYIYALDANNGDLKWRFKTGGFVQSSPAIADGIVYVGSQDAYIYALDVNNGDLKWKFKTDSGIYSSPIIWKDFIYIGSGDTYLYALDVNNGELKWKYKTKDVVFSSPAVSNGLVFITSDINTYAIDAKDGSLKWKYQIDGGTFPSPTVYGDIVYSVSLGGTVYALDTYNGDLKWKYKTGSIIYYSPATDGDTVYIGSQDSFVHAINAKDGSLKWKYKFIGNDAGQSVAISGQMIYVGSGDTHLYALDADTGTMLWKYKTGSHIDSSPAISGQTVYIGSDYVYAFTKKDMIIETDKNDIADIIPDVTTLITETLLPTSISTSKSNASYDLHGERTDVGLGENILLKGSIVNYITKPKMHVQIIIIPPSGMSVTSVDFIKSPAGQFTSDFEVEPGQGKDIEVTIISNQIGNFNVKGRIIYYFGDDKDRGEYYDLNLPIRVRPKELGIQTPVHTNTKHMISGFTIHMTIIGISFIFLFLLKTKRGN